MFALGVMVLAMACGGDPSIRADFAAGQPVEEVLRQLTLQREHLYVAVRDEAALQHRLAVQIRGDMPMSDFCKRFAAAANLEVRYYPYEVGSPRGTLKVGSTGAAGTKTYAVIHRGVVRKQAPQT